MPFAPPPSPEPVIWAAKPSPQEVAEAEAFYAPTGTRAAAVSMTCYVRADGGLEACTATPGADEDDGYEEAALKLADRYRLDLGKTKPTPTVHVRLEFPKLYDADPKVVAKPAQNQLDKANPLDLDGQATLLCTVTDAGAVQGCRVSQTPDHDARLDAVALAVADDFRFRPARKDGRPVAARAAITVETKPHVSTAPSWLRKPTGDDLLAAFPVAAMREGRSGWGRIKCDVAIDGTLVNCKVLSEAPEGYGFGAAALVLAPNFRMKPRLIDGKPVGGASVVIPIKFETPTPGARIADTGSRMRVLPWAPWTAVPSAAAIEDAFPERAKKDKAYGSVAMRCEISPDGRLKTCETTSESPRGYGLAKAARDLTPAFSLDVTGVKPPDLREMRVLVTIAFTERTLTPPEQRSARTVDWVRSFTADDVASAYPPQAVAAGTLSGRSTVACRVGLDGTLQNCATKSETPTGLGFGDAALKIAKIMRANSWSQDGEPTAGETIVIPMRLIYDGEMKVAPAPGK